MSKGSVWPLVRNGITSTSCTQLTACESGRTHQRVAGWVTPRHERVRRARSGQVRGLQSPPCPHNRGAFPGPMWARALLSPNFHSAAVTEAVTASDQDSGNTLQQTRNSCSESRGGDALRDWEPLGMGSPWAQGAFGHREPSGTGSLCYPKMEVRES